MEDGRFDVVVGDGVTRAAFNELRPFTLVGATTRSGLLTLRDRFGVVFGILYTGRTRATRSARLMDVQLVGKASLTINGRSWYACIANHYCDESAISRKSAQTALSLNRSLKTPRAVDIDRAGFDRMDRRLMLTMIDKFDGGLKPIPSQQRSVKADCRRCL